MRDRTPEDLYQKIQEIAEQSTRDNIHHLLKKYGTLTDTRARNVNGAGVEIRDYTYRDDTYRVIEVNGETITIETLAKEEHR